MEDYMLTTYDNPFNPFDEFERWWKEDMLLGHNCCGILAREAATSPLFSDEENDRLTHEAMDRIVAMEPLIYRKTVRDDWKKGA